MGTLETHIGKVIFWLFRVMGRVPRHRAVQAGRLLGRILFVIDNKHRQIAIENLSQSFANEKQPNEIASLARAVFENLGQILFEVGWALRMPEHDFTRHFKVRGLANLKGAYEKNQGILILTAHMGNWELLTNVAAMTGYPLGIVVRPLDFSPLESFFRCFRTRFGATLIPTKNSMRMVLEGLKERSMVALLMDQNVDWYDGVFVSFFGRPACTNRGLALLALKTGAPVVPVFLVRDGDGFAAEFGSEVPLIRTGDKTADVEANTQRYNDIIESFVRRHPDQWFWVHQRWKTKNRHEWPTRE